MFFTVRNLLFDLTANPQNVGSDLDAAKPPGLTAFRREPARPFVHRRDNRDGRIQQEIRFDGPGAAAPLPSALLLNTQTEREAMGHLSKYYPIRSRSSGVSNQGRTRLQNSPPRVQRNTPV